MKSWLYVKDNFIIYKMLYHCKSRGKYIINPFNTGDTSYDNTDFMHYLQIQPQKK